MSGKVHESYQSIPELNCSWPSFGVHADPAVEMVGRRKCRGKRVVLRQTRIGYRGIKSSLSKGVFSPYADIPTNLLFFDRSGPTKHIWYYEHPLPEGRKTYTKTNPLKSEEFEPCLAWWKRRDENDRAWKVFAKDLLKYDVNGSLVSVNLDLKNPSAKEDLEHLPPEQLANSILEKEQRIKTLVEEIKRSFLISRDQ
jgi:N-6 DNA methylase